VKYDHFLQKKPGKFDNVWVYRTHPSIKESLPLFVIHAGYSHWQENRFYKRDLCNLFAVEYVCAGGIRLIQNSREYQIGPDEVYFLRKGAKHYYETGKDGFVLKRFVAIGGPLLTPTLNILNLTNKDVLKPKNHQKIKSMFRDITRLLGTAAEESFKKMSVVIYSLLLGLSESLEAEMPPIIERVVSFMYENLNRGLRRKELSEYTGLSEVHLNRVFKKYMDKAPIQYFHEQKMNWIAQLLWRTRFSVKEIAYKAGYEDPLYLSAQFKKHFGVSPLEYRRSAADTAKDIN
jgi:AraC-like DNA-binding protein